ncbi:MAG: (Fe-S)-binding protein [Desulfatiglandaceae bacterium]
MTDRKKPKRVSLFIPCLVEHFLPHVGEATARVLARAGVEVDYPEAQTCCGQMAFKAGHHRDARRTARHFMEVFEASDFVVAPSGSCVGMVRKQYPVLFREDAMGLDRAAVLGRKTYELTEFLVKVLGIIDLGATWPGRAVYHDSCQLSRGLGVREEPRVLLSGVHRLEMMELERAETCCGFGGAFSLEFPVISEKMVEDKAAAVVKSGAQFLISAEPGCLMNIGGYLEKQGEKVKAVHIAEVLANRAGESWK